MVFCHLRSLPSKPSPQPDFERVTALISCSRAELSILSFWVLCTCFRVENFSSKKRDHVHRACLIQGNNGSIRFFVSKRHQKTIKIIKNLYLSNRRFYVKYNNNINIRQNIFLTYLK